jgi:hypothetical protein
LVQAFLKKWWVESSRFHYGSNAMRFKRSLERMNKKFLNFQFYLLTHTSTMASSNKSIVVTPPAIRPASSEDIRASVRHSVK